ncbi:MAG: c-type cytochrome [Nitrospirae bacterium]|nr:c-type cytochrome [Nitrospirota bacterium]
MSDTFDGIKEGHSRIPKGVMVLFIGLAAWAVWYVFSFTPTFSGWSQGKIYEERLASSRAAVKEIPYENPYEKDPKAIAEGKGIYEANCASCHGANLKGGVGNDLTAHFKYGETDKDKYLSIFSGRGGGMPGFGDQLGRDRTWKVLAYMDSVREYGMKP